MPHNTRPSNPGPAHSVRQVLFVAVVGFATISTIACNDRVDPRRTGFRVDKDNVTAKYDEKTGKLRAIELDSDKNGKVDTWTYMDGARIDRIEIDRDGNGQVDRWEYYDADKRLLRVGTSTRGDGVVDEWSYADANGVLQRVESDTDRAGRVDKWQRFAPPAASGGAPILVSVEIDTDKRGAPTQRLIYRLDGTLDRVEKVTPQ